MHTHCTHCTHTLYTHCTLTVHTHCTHSLYTHTVHTPYTHTVHSHCTHTHCTLTLHMHMHTSVDADHENGTNLCNARARRVGSESKDKQASQPREHNGKEHIDGIVEHIGLRGILDARNGGPGLPGRAPLQAMAGAVAQPAAALLVVVMAQLAPPLLHVCYPLCGDVQDPCTSEEENVSSCKTHN